MKSDVIIMKTEQFSYPAEAPFRPSIKYPEYLFPDEISNRDNQVYEMVRQGFYKMGMDVEHYGTKQWNPLKDVVKPGNFVVIKPNLVMDVNMGGGGTDCLYTHPSVVAPVIDFVLKALDGRGEIVVGDAPMQECNFERLITESHYKELIEFYKSRTTVKVSLVDFRDLHSERRHGMNYSSLNSKASGVLVDLGGESEFHDASSYFYDHLRITNYDPAILKTHHNAEKHEYYVNKNVLRADVIINMPKPKTHRKAGVTIALKNLVGINSRKEYLPHHTNGSKKEGGDEYLNASLLKRIKDMLLDKRNYYMQTRKAYLRVWLLQQMIRGLNQFIKITQKDCYFEGSWYGNDTISKTIIDLNKILLYADKEGRLCEKPQRKYLIVADMIISGEKEGPVMPSAKDVGIIALGTNPVCFDEAIAVLMGAKQKYISTLYHARNTKSIYRLVQGEQAFLVSNDPRWNEKRIEDLTDDEKLFFQPTQGWKEAFYEKDAEAI